MVFIDEVLAKELETTYARELEKPTNAFATSKSGGVAPPTGGASVVSAPSPAQPYFGALEKESIAQTQQQNQLQTLFNQAPVPSLPFQQAQAQTNYVDRLLPQMQQAFQGVLPQIQQTQQQNAFLASGAGRNPLLDQGFAQAPPTNWFEAGQQANRFNAGTLFDAFDAASETVFDVANVNPLTNLGTTAFDVGANVLTGGGDDIVADFKRRLLGGNLPQNIFESRGNPLETLQRQQQDFSSRPLPEQFGVGIAGDPLNAFPVVGVADDIADLARLGGAVGRKLPGLGREAIEAGARQLPAPTPTQRLATGAIDPSTGRPFEYQAVGGAGIDIPAIDRPDLPLGRITEPAPPTEIRTPTSPTALKVQNIMDVTPLPPSRFLREEPLRQQRASQFAARRAAADAARELGLTGQAAAAFRQAAMRVDSPIGRANRARRLTEEFSPDEIGSLYDEVLAAEDSGRITNAEAAQATAGLETMFSTGDLPFQSQANALGKALGLDIIGRESTIAKLSPSDVELSKLAPKGEIRIRELEIRAERQFDLAADLRKRANARPTNQRLKQAADLAQQRATTLRNAADRMELDKTQRFVDDAIEKATRAGVAGERRATATLAVQGEVRDRAAFVQIRKDIQAGKELTPEDLARIEAAPDGEKTIIRLEREAKRAEDAADKMAEQARHRPLSPQFEKRANELRQQAANKRAEADLREQLLVRKANETAAERAAREHSEAVNRANRRATIEQQRKDLALPNDEQILRQAEKLLGENFPESVALNQQALEALDLWLQGNRQILDTIGEPSSELLTSIAGAVRGDYDSFTTALIRRRDMIRGVLESVGVEPDVASRVARTLLEHELMRRYNGVLPARVKQAAQRGFEATPVPTRTAEAVANTRGGRISEGFGELNQMWKNTAFSLFDVGVAGLNILDLMLKQGPLAMLGMVNRLAAAVNHPFVLTQMADSSLPKVIQNQLDGLAVGNLARTGIVDIPEAGSFFKFIPKVGPAIDRVIDLKSRIEFGLFLGIFRQLAQEGGLMVAKAVGSDIQDATVRRNVSHLVNVSSGAGATAVRGGRKAVERGALLSAPLTRAQFQYFGELARILSPSAKVTREQRLLAAMSGVTYAVAVGAMGKFINDRMGVGEYEANPLKPGFGLISLPGGVTISVVPQAQLLKTLGRSVEVLMDGVQGEDAGEIRDIWSRFAMGRSSPVLQTGFKAAGWGYDPNTGWQFGDWGEGMSTTEKLISAAPIPPVFSSIQQEGFDPLRTGFEAAGIPAFEESVFSQQEREFKDWVGGLTTAERNRLATDLKDFNGKTLDDASFTDIMGMPTWRTRFQDAAPEAFERAQQEDAERAERGDPDAERRVRSSTIREEEIVKPLEALSEQFANRAILPETFSAERRRILDSAYTKLEEVWQGYEAGPVKDTLDEYREIVEGNKDEKGNIDWDAVTADVLQLPKGKQRIIDQETGLGITREDQQYRDAIEEIANDRIPIPLPSGGMSEPVSYFEVDDVLFEAFLTDLGADKVDAQGNPWTRQSYEDAVFADFYKMRRDQGMSDADAVNVARVDADRFLRPLENKITEIRGKYRDINQDAGDTLRFWGIGGTGQEETAESLNR